MHPTRGPKRERSQTWRTFLRNQINGIWAADLFVVRTIDGHQRTLEEVGKRIGVTRERIRQIEAKALRKLRHPSRSKKLRDYLE